MKNGGMGECLVRSWHLADIGVCAAHVCFRPKADIVTSNEKSILLGRRDLSIFNNLHYDILARRALIRALVIIRLIRFNLDKPHALAALWTRRFFEANFGWGVLRVAQGDLPILNSGGSATSLSSTGSP